MRREKSKRLAQVSDGTESPVQMALVPELTHVFVGGVGVSGGAHRSRYLFGCRQCSEPYSRFQHEAR
ncbi:hypothetical protein C1280_03145 [Gemmata obscuriglobus]|uniref:Uncharacterized protein n=1 Tax=Gemmata obscuriglobus TaxID=114 RepID=A0A2Z3GP93_9BACT|nr:hypothetical protein C1280_03145 [Gemmata obscuriglobus]